MGHFKQFDFWKVIISDYPPNCMQHKKWRIGCRKQKKRKTEKTGVERMRGGPNSVALKTGQNAI